LSKTQDVMEHLYVIGSGATEASTTQMEKLDCVEKSPVKYEIGVTSRRYVVFTVPQSVSTEHWEYNGQKPAVRNLGVMPVFESGGSGEIVYTRFYQVYLPAYVISALALVATGSLLFTGTLRRRRGKKQNDSELGRG